MKKSTKTVHSTSALLFAALLAVPAGAQNEPGRFTLYLEPSKSRLVLGEPLYATARLRNDGADEVRLAIDLNPSLGYLTVEVTGLDGGVRPFVPLGIGDAELEPLVLPPGDELTAVFPIFFGGRGWTFATTGSYRLSAVLEGLPGPPSRSAPVTVEVVEGDGAGRYLFDTTAEDLRETGKFLIWQHGDHLRRAHATLGEIISTYPSSPLSDYAHLAIGLNLSKSFHDYGIGRVRPAQPEEALDRLRQVNPEILPDLLRIQRDLGMARAYVGLDRPADARSSIETAREDASDQAALQKMIEAEIEFDAALQKAN